MISARLAVKGRRTMGEECARYAFVIQLLDQLFARFLRGSSFEQTELEQSARCDFVPVQHLKRHQVRLQRKTHMSRWIASQLAPGLSSAKAACAVPHKLREQG